LGCNGLRGLQGQGPRFKVALEHPKQCGVGQGGAGRCATILAATLLPTKNWLCGRFQVHARSGVNRPNSIQVFNRVCGSLLGAAGGRDSSRASLRELSPASCVRTGMSACGRFFWWCPHGRVNPFGQPVPLSKVHQLFVRFSPCIAALQFRFICCAAPPPPLAYFLLRSS
jgi:hypothetical protein